jgi:hypothetical protein
MLQLLRTLVLHRETALSLSLPPPSLLTFVETVHLCTIANTTLKSLSLQKEFSCCSSKNRGRPILSTDEYELSIAADTDPVLRSELPLFHMPLYTCFYTIC